jgi:hypothetical protein
LSPKSGKVEKGTKYNSKVCKQIVTKKWKVEKGTSTIQRYVSKLSPKSGKVEKGTKYDLKALNCCCAAAATNLYMLAVHFRCM